jgi:signal transduction histidine kinase/CheY-like chemotaxis protein
MEIFQQKETDAAYVASQRVRRRLAFLEGAGRTSSGSVDTTKALRALARAAVPELGDYCFFDLHGDGGVDGGVIERAAFEHADRLQRDARTPPSARGLAWDAATHPTVNALRTGRPQLVSDLSDLQRQQILNAEVSGELAGVQALCSVISVPLRIGDQTVGALTLCFAESNRHHSEEDLPLAEDLAQRAAIVVHNARLHRDAERVARELDRERAHLEAVLRSQQVLVEAGTLLASSLEYQVTLRRIAELAVPALADCCLIHMHTPADGDGDGAGEVRRVAQVFHERSDLAELAIPFKIDLLKSDSPLSIVLRTGKSVWIRELGSKDLGPGGVDVLHLGAARATHPRSMICVPLAARGRTLGMMTFVSSRADRLYDQADLSVAEQLGQRAAWAVDSALLYEAAERARQRSEEARAESETANRLKDNFLATVSHELRTPMAALLLWESILRTTKDEVMRTRALEAIHQSAVAQSKLIEDLLDISRCISGKLRIEPSPVAVLPVINSAVEAAVPLATAKGIQIEFVCPEALGYVMGDASRLRQIVDNLLSNAIKFTGAGGQITLSAGRRLDRLEIVVTDNGQGISAEFLPDVFKPFRQADGSLTRAQAGLGLGLAIVRQLVEMHDGSVRADSPGAGGGSSFTVTLPLLSDQPVARVSRASTPAPSEAERGRRAGDARALKGLRVLVVDDEPRVREAIVLVLSDAGSRVTAASSAAEAFGLLRGGGWDVVVSDIGMPEEDGYSLIRRVRGLDVVEGGGVAAVALTAYARALDQSRAIEAGFDLHLAKPVDAEDLIRAVATVRRPLSGAVPPAGQRLKGRASPA